MKSKLTLVLALLLPLTGQASAGVKETVSALLPRLGAAKAEDRYAPQMELQSLSARASLPGAEAERAELASILSACVADADLPQVTRVWLVRQLEYVGAAESVAALTSLLGGSDAELRECARRALEKNSAPEASQSLYEALQKAEAMTWKLGLIHSLGERGDEAAVNALVLCLSQKDLAAGAATALGKIASPSAIEALWKIVPKEPAASEALVTAAGRLLNAGKPQEAKAICARLYAECAILPLRSAALVLLAQADPAAAKELIPQALSASETRLQTAGIAAARLAWGKDTPRMLMDLMGTLPPGAKVLALREVDKSAEKMVIGMMADRDEAVRLAALETLGRIGGAPSVAILVKCAADSQPPASQIAALALRRISGPGADATLLKLSGRADENFRASAIRALAERHYRPGVPTLLKHASDTNRVVSAAAWAAVGQLAADEELDEVLKLALASGSPQAEAALESIVNRLQQKPAAANKLIAFARSAQPPQLPCLLGCLGILGGAEALTALSQFAASHDAATQDAAIRALAGSPDPASVKPLLEIAASPNTKPVHNILAVQGVTRLVTASEDQPAQVRVEAALAALKAARRAEEKKLALSALASVEDAKAAEAIKPFLADAVLKQDAGSAAIRLAESLLRPNKSAARDLAQAVKEANLSITLTGKAEAILEKLK